MIQTASPSPPRLALDGVVLIDKPSGITSNAALQRARRALNAVKAGHTGTLDPLATGLLPICLGEATKFSALLLDADKTYVAEIAFGATTTTGDAAGEIVQRGDLSDVSDETMWRSVESLLGKVEQVPPMYSALKYKGRALYDYARAGETVERQSRTVTVFDLALIDAGPSWLRVRLRVSKGTYIRSLAEEAGRRLGCGAHLRALRRERAGSLSIDQAVPLATLEGMDAPNRAAQVAPMDLLLAALPRIELGAAEALGLQQGRAVRVGMPLPEGLVRVYGSSGGFLGVGTGAPEGLLRPYRLLRQAAATAPVV